MQYHVCGDSLAPAELERLGKDGWELVTVHQGEWIFRRPEPDAAERFTREQRAAVLSGEALAPFGPATRHLLNPLVASLIRRVNHTQMLLVADRGYPVPPGLEVIDLSLTADIPTIPQVLAAILPDFPLDRVVAAEEMREASQERWQWHRQHGARVETCSHLAFKRLARQAVGCIRTGDSVPYSNLLLVGG